MLISRKIIQYNAACNYISYHDVGITFWLFSSCGIMASKKEISAEQGGSRASGFVIGFVAISEGQQRSKKNLKDPSRI